MQIAFFSLITLAVAFEVFADILLKKWIIESNTTLFAIAMVLYVISVIFWAYSLKYQMLSKAITIFAVVNLIVIVLVGVIFFKESLNTTNIIGIILGILSVVLISL